MIHDAGERNSPIIHDFGERNRPTSLEGRRRAQGSATLENAADAANPRAEEPARIELFPDKNQTQSYVEPSQQNVTQTDNVPSQQPPRTKPTPRDAQGDNASLLADSRQPPRQKGWEKTEGVVA